MPSRERENAACLAAALRESERERSALDEAEAVVADAEDVTTGVERAQELVDLLRDGADPKAVASELDALLALLVKKQRAGRFTDVLRLVKVLLAALVLSLRWRDLVAATRIAAEAAEAVGDVAEQAWALQELATLATLAELPSLAGELAGEARDLFEQAGDHLGAELSSQTLAQVSAPATHGLAGNAAGWVATHKAAALVAVVAGGVLLATGHGSVRRPAEIVLLASGLNTTFADPAVSTDRDGVVHVLWRVDVPDTAADVIVTRRRAPDAQWSTVERLSETRHAAGAPHLVRRPSGELCALWTAYLEQDSPIGFGDSRLWERCFVRGRWTPRREVASPSKLGGDIRSGMLGTYTPAGRFRVVMNHLGNLSSRGQPLNGEGTAYTVAFVADGRSVLHAIWYELGTGLLHRLSQDGGRTWTSARPVGESSYVIDVAADLRGQVHLVTSYDDDVFYARWTEARGWERQREVSGEFEGASYPGIGVGHDGRATVAWCTSDGLALATQRGDGSFRRAAVVRDPLLPGAGRASIAVDDEGFREIVVLLEAGGLVHVEAAP